MIQKKMTNQLIRAITRNIKNRIKELLDAGVDVDQPNYRGLYPLHEAFRSNKYAFHLLLTHGANINILDKNEKTLLMNNIWHINIQKIY